MQVIIELSTLFNDLPHETVQHQSLRQLRNSNIQILEISLIKLNVYKNVKQRIIPVSCTSDL